MYEYLYVIIVSFVFIYLMHYVYENIKDSIVYCSHHETYQNYETVGVINETNEKSEEPIQETN